LSNQENDINSLVQDKEEIVGKDSAVYLEVLENNNEKSSKSTYSEEQVIIEKEYMLQQNIVKNNETQTEFEIKNSYKKLQSNEYVPLETKIDNQEIETLSNDNESGVETVPTTYFYDDPKNCYSLPIQKINIMIDPNYRQQFENILPKSSQVSIVLATNKSESEQNQNLCAQDNII